MMGKTDRRNETCPKCRAPVQLLWRTGAEKYAFFVACSVCRLQTGAHETGMEAWREWDAICAQDRAT